MSTIKRIAVTVCVAASLGTSAGQAVATGSTGNTGRGFAAPTFVLPADYVQITDDTGSITVAVPNTWTDVSTLPFADEAGNTLPRITAATNYQVFHDTFDAPGVEYVAVPFDADQQGLMSRYGLTGGCGTTETTPYNDGAFVGLHGVWSDCGPTGLPEWHQLVVAPADNSRTLVLQVQITSQAELPILQNIMDSFNTGSGGPPATTVPGVPTVPPSLVTPTLPPVPTVPPSLVTPTVPPSVVVPTFPLPTVPPSPVTPTVPPSVVVPTFPLPTVPPSPVMPTVPPSVVVPTFPLPTVPGVPTSVGAVPPGFVQLVDDSQTISMIVPTTWTDVNTAAFVYDNGSTSAQIMASTNIQQWESTFNVPGARLLEIQFAADPTTLISQIGLEPGSCPTEVVEPFTNGQFSGMIGRWAGCGPAGTSEYDIIVAGPADQSRSYILMVQSTGPADQAAVATVIASFGPATPGAVTTPTVITAVPVPTVPVPTVPVPTGSVPTATIPTPATAPGG